MTDATIDVPAFSWTAATVARLTELWGAGKSAGKVAKAIGATRNQVIGKVHRLGLDSRPSPIIRPGVSMLALQPHHCRWPVGHPGEDGFHFCGRRKVAGSYCSEHARLAFQPGTSMAEMERLRKRPSGERRKIVIFGGAA